MAELIVGKSSYRYEPSFFTKLFLSVISQPMTTDQFWAITLRIDDFWWLICVGLAYRSFDLCCVQGP